MLPQDQSALLSSYKMVKKHFPIIEYDTNELITMTPPLLSINKDQYDQTYTSCHIVQIDGLTHYNDTKTL